LREGSAEGCSIRVVADDGLLIAALREQRGLGAGWRIAAFDGTNDSTTGPDGLVVVDLEDSAGRRAALDRVRAAGFGGPILVLGGDGIGQPPAEQSIPRPVRLGALLARIRACASAMQSAGVTSIGPYTLAPAECALRDSRTGELIRLTELELKLLTYLMDSHGQLVDREQLLRDVWGYSATADTHTVETHVWRLRQKIETDDPETRFIVTETGGYRLALVGFGAAG
jgi:hypothetical protein